MQRLKLCAYLYSQDSKARDQLSALPAILIQFSLCKEVKMEFSSVGYYFLEGIFKVSYLFIFLPALTVLQDLLHLKRHRFLLLASFKAVRQKCAVSGP